MDDGPLGPGRVTEHHVVERTTVTPRKPVTRRRLVVRLLIMTVILVVLVGGLYAFNEFRRNAIAQFFANNRPPPTAVAAVEAKSEPSPRSLTGIGSLAAVRQVAVAPEVGGRVTKIFFQSGQQVAAGDPLVQLNDQTEQAQLRGLRAQTKLSEVSLGRARKLLPNQYATQASVDQLQAQLDQARAEAQRVQVLIEQKLIRAPIKGVLGLRQIDLGAYLQANDPIVTLTDLDPLYVNFTLPEQARTQIETGQAITLTSDAFPGRKFEGKVTAIEPQVDSAMRAIKVQATLPNPERLLLPGMFANVQVVLPPAPDVVTLPETAVEYTLYGDSVYLIREEGRDDAGKPILKAHRTFVKTGERFDGRVAVLSGVSKGDLVVATGQLKVNDGAQVTVADNAALPTPAQTPRQ